MRVEEEHDDGLLDSVRIGAIPGVRSRSMGRDAARLNELLLTASVRRPWGGKYPRGYARPRPACGGAWHGAFLCT